MSNIKKNEIIKRYGTDITEMTLTLLEYSDLASDISDINKCIGIKPNLVCPTPADFGATTHPEIVEAIIIYLKDHVFYNISVMEGSWVGDKTSEAYINCGYKEVCEKHSIEFIDTQKNGSHTVNCDGVELSVCNCVDTVDYLINVPVLKGHCQTKMTCALKNSKGLIPNSEKRRFHTMGLHKPIAHLSKGIHQDFIVVDHICGDPTFEEGGNPVKTDCIMVAKDPVLVDSYACKLLGLKADDVPYIKMAEKLGSGCSDLSGCNVTILNEKGEAIKVIPGDADEPSEMILASNKRMIDVSVDIDDCESCSACFASLTGALYMLKDENTDISSLPKISIGQGHKNSTGDFGIGNCCKNFTRYVPGCPPSEEDIYAALCKYE